MRTSKFIWTFLILSLGSIGNCLLLSLMSVGCLGTLISLRDSGNQMAIVYTVIAAAIGTVPVCYLARSIVRDFGIR